MIRTIVSFHSKSLQTANRLSSSSRLHQRHVTALFCKKVVFLGTPDVAATSLQQIVDKSKEFDFEVVAVVTQPPKPRKRKKDPEPSPVGKIAEQLGIQVMAPEKAKDPDFLQQLEDMQPDLCITAAYGQYLPKRFLATPKYGTVNIHPSLLPRWRGASPVQRSLQAGDNPVGVTVLFTVSKMDAGPIIAQKEVTVDENDTADYVLPMLFQHGTDLLIENMPKLLQGEITMETATKQDDEHAVAASMIDSSEGEMKVWEESAGICHNKLRGFSMWPGAFIYVQVGDREPMKVKVIKTRVVDESREPTDVIELGPNKGDGLYLVCHDGSVLELITVQPATRKAFPARDFQNGYPGETIRWVKTPEDQAQSPEKYNSRKAQASLSKAKETIPKAEASPPKAKEPISNGSKTKKDLAPVLSFENAWKRVETGGALVPVNKETVEFTSGILGGSAGLLVGGLPLGVFVAALANYSARRPGDFTDIVRGTSTSIIEVLNYLASLEAKYRWITKSRDSLQAKIEEYKSSGSIDRESLDRVEVALTNVNLKFKAINEEYDVVGALFSSLNTFGDIIESTANKALVWNEDNRVTEKALASVKENVEAVVTDADDVLKKTN